MSNMRDTQRFDNGQHAAQRRVDHNCEHVPRGASYFLRCMTWRIQDFRRAARDAPV
jgi:hypothetical protein